VADAIRDRGRSIIRASTDDVKQVAVRPTEDDVAVQSRALIPPIARLRSLENHTVMAAVYFMKYKLRPGVANRLKGFMNSKYVGLGASLGLCFGAAWGAALHILGGSLGTDVGVGIALGVSLGTVFGATLGMAPSPRKKVASDKVLRYPLGL
jgi:hypothetical protein